MSSERGQHSLRRRNLYWLACAAVLTVWLVGARLNAHGQRRPDTPPPDTPPPVTVLALGDSVPAGSACGCPGFVELLDRPASGSQPAVDTVNLAVPGLTSQGMLDQLKDRQVMSTVTTSAVVILTIGANDFDPDRLVQLTDGYQAPLRQTEANLTAAMRQIRALRSTVRILVLGYWNVFLDGVVGQRQGPAYRAGSDALTRRLNVILRSVARAHGGSYVDLYTPFRGDGDRDDTELLAADGDHPSASGHRLIAKTLSPLLAPP